MVLFVHTFVSSLSARAVGPIEDAATSKPQKTIMGIATIDILEIDFHCIEISF